MADWFKIFETDLDETRMRFALTQRPEVWPVWTALLMECCKHRSDTIRWGDTEQELFGFSDRLKISIPLVNESVRVLCDIKYIQKEDGFIKVLKWNEKQNDYLQRKAQGYWEKRREKKRVTVIHSDSHLEEKRGDEIRREEREKDALSRYPSEQEVKAKASMTGIPESVAMDFFNHFEASGWIDKNGNPVRSWPNRLALWWSDHQSRKNERNHHAGNGSPPTSEETKW